MKMSYVFPTLMISLFALSGCDNAQLTHSSQLAAKVNDDVITVHQLDLAINAMEDGNTDTDITALRKAVLNNMIIQTLLEQEAEKVDLDREPHVIQAIEAAKRKVLAAAYMQEIAIVNPSVSDADIEQYYSANTDLFANRKLFVYEQVTVQSDIENFKDVDKKVRQLDNVNDFISWLEKRSIPYKVITEAKTSEHIPHDLLKPLSTLDIGQIGFMNLNDGLVVIEVEDKQLQPIEYEMAAPAIKQLLQIQQQKAQLEQTVNSLKQAAAIEYNQDFAPDPSTLSLDNTSSVQADINQDSYLERGLQGLK